MVLNKGFEKDWGLRVTLVKPSISYLKNIKTRLCYIAIEPPMKKYHIS